MRASQCNEFIDHAGSGGLAGFAGELLPECVASERAGVVGIAIGPVHFFKAVGRQAGDAHHRSVRLGIGRTGQYHSIIKNHSAQRQSSPSFAPVYGDEGRLLSLCTMADCE